MVQEPVTGELQMGQGPVTAQELPTPLELRMAQEPPTVREWVAVQETAQAQLRKPGRADPPREDGQCFPA
jgi:hypothetical protein